jgi:hypothetical protein
MCRARAAAEYERGMRGVRAANEFKWGMCPARTLNEVESEKRRSWASGARTGGWV